MKAFIPAAITLMFWASSFSGIKQGLEGYSPGHFVLLRFLIASMVFLLLAVFTGKIGLPRKRDVGKIFGLALLGISIYHSFLTFGETVVPAGTAGLLIGSVPAFTAVFVYLFFKDKLTWMGWLGVLLGFAGVAVISFGTSHGFEFASGAILILIAAISTSLFFIFQQPMFNRYSAIEMTAYFVWFGTIPLLIFIPGFFDAVASAPTASTLSGFYLGIFSSGIAYLTWAIALSNAPASLVTSALYLDPALAIVIAWIWLGDLPEPLAFVGGALTIAGVILVNFYGKEKLPAQERKAV
ncbi:MAG TPA: DMT family transporter [Bacillales bacterium]|nr:DMT family transporter [Bacillales bacterium]